MSGALEYMHRVENFKDIVSDPDSVSLKLAEKTRKNVMDAQLVSTPAPPRPYPWGMTRRPRWMMTNALIVRSALTSVQTPQYPCQNRIKARSWV